MASLLPIGTFCAINGVRQNVVAHLKQPNETEISDNIYSLLDFDFL
jgi:hypothetical protein